MPFTSLGVTPPTSASGATQGSYATATVTLAEKTF